MLHVIFKWFEIVYECGRAIGFDLIDWGTLSGMALHK